MALQDLTPQLRTRLNRMEWAVGWFLFLATALLLFGFGYYLYKTAENRGWFKNKAKYFIFTDTAKGLNINDPVEMLGKSVGTITRVETMPARGEGSEYNIYVEFEILEPSYGYIWTEGSRVSVASANPLLGNRTLEIARGSAGYSTYISNGLSSMSVEAAMKSENLTNLHLGEEIRDGTNVIVGAWKSLSKITNLPASVTNIWVIDKSVEKKYLTAVWDPKERHYIPLTKTTKPYGLPTAEEPALTDRLQALVKQVEVALPNILAMTNQLNMVLSNTASMTSNMNAVAELARPSASNLRAITAQLRDPKGTLGEWLIPTNINQQLDTTLRNVNVTVTNADTNLVALAESIQLSLNNLANITSNLNAQVQANSNMVTQISDIVVHSDQFVQGLKHHWLLRSAFKTKDTNAPAARSSGAVTSPRAKDQ